MARTSRLSIAARALDLDATTVGRRLDQLAAAFGTSLFKTGSAGRSLTERGIRLLAHAGAIEAAAFAAKIEASSGFLNSSNREADIWRGRCRRGASPARGPRSTKASP